MNCGLVCGKCRLVRVVFHALRAGRQAFDENAGDAVVDERAPVRTPRVGQPESPGRESGGFLHARAGRGRRPGRRRPANGGLPLAR